MTHVLNSLTAVITADVSRYVWHSTIPRAVDICQFSKWTFFALVQTNELMFISAVHCECLFTSSFLFFHGYIAVAAFFSTVIFRTAINCSLQVGHPETCSLQLLQTLCPFSHIFIGGAIYSKQTGHSICRKRIHSSWLTNIFCFALPTWTRKRSENDSGKLLRYTYFLGRHDTIRWIVFWVFPRQLLLENRWKLLISRMFLSTLWRHVRRANIQLYLLIEHGAILRLECACYKSDLQQSIERVRAK